MCIRDSRYRLRPDQDVVLQDALERVAAGAVVERPDLRILKITATGGKIIAVVVMHIGVRGPGEIGPVEMIDAMGTMNATVTLKEPAIPDPVVNRIEPQDLNPRSCLLYTSRCV